MQLSVYKDAVSELAVPKLTEFVKLMSDYVEIEGWSKMRAPEKRDSIMDALSQSKELRKEFVVYYGEQTGSDTDFSEWETADLPDTPAEEPPLPPGGDEPAQTLAEEDAAEEADTPNPTPVLAKPTAFVEGAFEQIVSDVAGLDAAQSKANLQEAEETLEFEHIRIGALLSHIQSSQHYITLGYDNLKEFLAAETGMQYRKATYLISNYNAVRELGIKASELKGVTWSALRHIIPVLSGDNYQTWLEAARNNTHVALIAQVEAEKAKQAGALPAPNPDGEAEEAPKPISKVFNVLPDQNASISAAIDKAKTEGNVESNGAALELIASAYTGAPPSDATVASVMPDTSKAGMLKIFSKMAADGGDDALVPILEAIDEIWPNVDITVEFPKANAAE